MDFSKYPSCTGFLWKVANSCFSPQIASMTDKLTLPPELSLAISLLSLITEPEVPEGAWVTLKQPHQPKSYTSMDDGFPIGLEMESPPTSVNFPPCVYLLHFI